METRGRGRPGFGRRPGEAVLHGEAGLQRRRRPANGRELPDRPADPPGSACSVSIGTGLEAGLQLVVSDIDAARAELVARGLDPGNVRNIKDGVWSDGKGGPWNSFLFFKDPDGNNWAVQEKPENP